MWAGVSPVRARNCVLSIKEKEEEGRDRAKGATNTLKERANERRENYTLHYTLGAPIGMSPIHCRPFRGAPGHCSCPASVFTGVVCRVRLFFLGAPGHCRCSLSLDFVGEVGEVGDVMEDCN